MATQPTRFAARWRLPILAALLGTFTAWATWAWPDTPLWRSGPDAGRLEGFSPDGRVIVTIHNELDASSQFPDPEVLRWDAATGILLSRARLPCADRKSRKAAHPAHDGSRVLVGEGPQIDPRSPSFITGTWYLHNGFTGERILGPIRGLAMAGMFCFSPDGRWFWGSCGEAHGGLEGLRGSAIFSAATGECLLEFPNREGKKAETCFFAPDGETVAVWWKNEREGDAEQDVDIIELPSGRRRAFVLPPRRWLWARRWDGRYLEAIVNGPDGTQDRRQECSCVLDLFGDAIGPTIEDPLLRWNADELDAPVHWYAEADWVALFKFDRPEAGLGWWEAAASWLGIWKAPGRSSLSAKVWYVNRATGATRYELPRPVHITLLFSTDGRRLVCATADNGVEVWDTDPPPRWPRALATGSVATAAVFGFGWWRRHRAARASAGAAQANAEPEIRRSSG